MSNRLPLVPRVGSIALGLALPLIGCDSEFDAGPDELEFEDDEFRAGGNNKDKDKEKENNKCKTKHDDDDGGEEPCTTAGCPCEGPETCDLGLVCSEGLCGEPLSICGDGAVEAAEQCDDGNLRDDDGCDSDCTPTQILDVVAGNAHNCLLLGHGGVRCWGDGAWGKLGNKSMDRIGDNELASAASNVPLAKPALAIAAGTWHTCALVEGGEIMCWGYTSLGTLGYGYLEHLGDDESLEALTRVWIGAPAVAVSAAHSVTCAQLQDGSVRCWGYNETLMLGYSASSSVKIGDNERPFQSPLVSFGEPVDRVAMHGRGIHACGLTEAGTVRCWGSGGVGALGYGNTNSRSTPGPAVLAIAQGLPLDTQISTLGVGLNLTCVSYSTGDATCWGHNAYGSLGRASTISYSNFYKPNQLPPIDFGGANIVDVSVGAYGACARTDTGEAFCFGRNNFGQLGYGHTQNIGDNETPAQAGVVDTGGVAIRDFAMGTEYTCAWLENDEVRCVGRNDFGQLGYGHTNHVNNMTFAQVGPVELF